MKRCRGWAVVVGACLATAAPLEAQGGSGKEGYTDVHHRNDCRLAHQVLTHGQPAVRRAWALEVAPGCGALGGQALAAALEELRNASAGAELEAVVYAASRLTDATVFQAALRLGSDAGAGPDARVAAWRVVQYQLVPGSYDEPAPAGDGAFTGGAREASTAAPLPGAPLPADRLDRARQAAEGAVAAGGAAQALDDVVRRVLASVELEERIERVCGPGASLWDEACEEALEADEAGQ